ncbi:MAG: HEPN domain-containing protein [Gemmatimonadota bacterium]
MANRSADWFRQAEADLRHARNAAEDGDHEWACFAAQQGAEKAVKAAIQALGGEPWGHSVVILLGALDEKKSVPASLVDAGKRLDKHYIPTRYPNGFDAGAPTDYYTGPEAEAAIADATEIVEFCRGAMG